MDLSTTIIGLLSLALFIVPVILISRSGKGNKRKLEKELFSEASINELKISEKDIWNEFAIGIDMNKNKILYLDWSGQDRINIIFDLKDVKIFEPVPGYSEQNKKNFNYKKVDRLGLRFRFNIPSKTDVNVTFHMEGFGQIKEDEIRLFKKWMDIIRKRMDSLSNNNLRHSA